MTHYRPMIRFILMALIILSVMVFFQPSPPAPKRLNQVCQIFKHRPRWYWAAKAARSKWGVPISVQMAIIFKESHFRASAKPPRKKLFGLIPWSRPTSAQGYAQAVDRTWQLYLRATHQRSASRHDFAKAVDFIGWYLQDVHHRLGVSFHDVDHLYLAYHEGSGAYLRGSYIKQPHLIQIAQQVRRRAQRYRQQLMVCQQHLPVRHWYSGLI